MEQSFDVFVGAFNQLGVQLVIYIPKLILTLLIWWVGKYLIHLGVGLIRKIDLKNTKFDDKAIGTLASVASVTGKVLLIMIVLDYWEIGKPIIAAFVQGLSLMLSIALGLAFGKALEPDAKTIVDAVKRQTGNKS